MYSNAISDKRSSGNQAADEANVRTFYERSPYPDLGAGLKDPSGWLRVLRNVKPLANEGKYLDAGCGTGHVMCGLARELTSWSATGIDLSAPSLMIARQLGEKYQLSNVSWVKRSYLDDLSDLGKFEVIGCHGTIHHSADPVSALNNLSKALDHGGMMYVHLYGWRIDRGKFEIKRLLDIFVPDINDIEGRWKIYQALMEHKRKRWLKRFVQKRLIDIYADVRNSLRNAMRSAKGVVWSPAWDVNYTEPTPPWIDHFCHPCERAYEVPDVVALFAEADLEIVSMAKQGREYPQLIPDGWRTEYERLPNEKKWEISELLADGGGSFGIVAMRKGEASQMGNHNI